MPSDNTLGSKFKRVSTDFLNLAVITKIFTPDEIQAIYTHTSVGKNSLGEMVTNLTLAGSLKAPTVVSINIECTIYRGWKEDPSPDNGSPPLRRRWRASEIEEALVMDGQERRPPPAIPDRYCTCRQRNHSRGAPEDLCQEDQRAGGIERHRGVGRGRRNPV